MSQAILTRKGTVVLRRTLRSLTVAEQVSNVEKQKRLHFDNYIRAKLGDSVTTPRPKARSYVPYEDNEPDSPPHLHTVDEDPIDGSGAAVFERPITDHWINAEVYLPQGEQLKAAKVKSRSQDQDGKIKGQYNDNPYLNTLTYNVEFGDGEIREYAANVIAQNMYSQVDDQGYHHMTLDSIVDFATDGNAVPKSQQYVTTPSGTRRLCKSTAGWTLLVKWVGGEQQWIPLSLLKESNPIEVAEFAVAHGIADEPAFSWWVPYTLRKRDRIILSV